MKNIKRMLALALALALALCLAAPAFAATIKITEKNGEALGTYVAYQLMTVTIRNDADPAVPDAAPKNPDAGETGYSYTVNPKYSEILQDVTGQDSDAAVITYLEGIASDSDQIRAFADAVYERIKGLGPDATADGDTFTVDQGYYLIVETETDGTTSLVMLDTAGLEELKVTTKEEVPTSQKKVQEKNDSTGATTGWQDGADYDIGDHVPFQLTGTMPADITGYDTYKIIFHDTLSAGLTLDADSIEVKIDGGTALTKGTDYTVTVPGADCSFEVTINDAIALGGHKSSVITVEYTATLGGDAVVIGADGNPNEMFMEYSNNPYDETKTGTTPVDKVTVFTYQLDVDKVDADGNALEGAVFTLFKKIKGAEGAEDTWEPIAEQLCTTNDAGTTFYFKGLDAGDYKLEETEAPDGFNPIDPVEFTIDSEYVGVPEAETPNAPTLDDLSATAAEGSEIEFTAGTIEEGGFSGHLATDIENVTGIRLPSTGGMGTTLFYIVGGVLVVGAAVLLVFKRRTDNSK